MSKRRLIFGLLLMLTALLMAFTIASAAISVDSITDNDIILEKIPGSVLEKLINEARIIQEHINPDSITAPTFKLPAGLKIIEDEAFEGTAIVFIDLPETVESIGEQAFANITTLRKVNIPERTKQISRIAFAGSNNVIINCFPGSYGRTWAQDNGIPFVSIMVIYAGTSALQISDKINSQSTVNYLSNADASITERKHQWRPVRDIYEDHNKEFETNRVLGRAPPVIDNQNMI